MLAVFLTVVMYRAKLLCCSGRLKMESRSRSPDSALRSTLVSWLIACVGNILMGVIPCHPQMVLNYRWTSANNH